MPELGSARKHALPPARRPLHWSADAGGPCPDRCRNEGRPRALGGEIEGGGQADPLWTKEGWPEPVDRGARAGGLREAMRQRLAAGGIIEPAPSTSCATVAGAQASRGGRGAPEA